MDCSILGVPVCRQLPEFTQSHVHWVGDGPMTLWRNKKHKLNKKRNLEILWYFIEALEIVVNSWLASNHLMLCRPLLLPSSIFPSIRVSSNESVLRIRWPKYWSFSFSISPSSIYSGLISFRMDWSDLLAVQGTLKSLVQQHSSKASILQCSAYFMVQLSHPYLTTGKTIALTRQTFVGKVTSLLFHMLSKLS